MAGSATVAVARASSGTPAFTLASVMTAWCVVDAPMVTASSVSEMPLISSMRLQSTTTDGAVPASCKSFFAATAPTEIYTGDQVRTMLESDFSTTTGCMTGMIVANYCPNVRNPIMSTADYVGVWVKVRHDYQTGLFGSGIEIKRSAVMRIEPRVA